MRIIAHKGMAKSLFSRTQSTIDDAHIPVKFMADTMHNLLCIIDRATAISGVWKRLIPCLCAGTILRLLLSFVLFSFHF